MDISACYRLLPGKTGEGETGLPLWMHLEDTAAVMEYLIARRIPPSVIRATELDHESFRKVCVFLARTHDMGKCTPLFAARILAFDRERRSQIQSAGLSIPELSEYAHGQKVPHAMAGEILLHSFQCPDGICSVVGAHHGKPSTGTDKTYDSETKIEEYPFCYYAKQKDVWHAMQEQLFHEALAKSGYASVEDLPKLSNCAQLLLCGLLIQADWIASNQTYFPMLREDDIQPKGYENCNSEQFQYNTTEHDNTAERVGQALEKLSLTDLWSPSIKEPDNDTFFRNRFAFSPNPVQKEAVSMARNAAKSGGLLIIEAQMGTGKTEAALAAAEILAEKTGSGGLYFGLPTQATSNGIFPRLSQWAEQASLESTHAIRLVHGMAEMNEDYLAFYRSTAKTDEEESSPGGLTVHSWFSGKKQALLADFVVGTVDTALMAALRQKHVMLRHLGLCGKVVIIDECHAYDAYMSRFLLCMLRWLGAYQVPVILLSATLPEKKKQEMIQAYLRPYSDKNKNKKVLLPDTAGYPLLTLADSRGICAKAADMSEAGMEVTVKRLPENSLVNALKISLAEGGCAGVIVNTVRRAQHIAETLRQQLPDKKVYLYHAQFVAQDRIRREKELTEMIGKSSCQQQRNNVIIIGTQVLEQSLDIDFDCLFTDLCPMDLLLQRMGRLHRHKRERPAPLSRPVCFVFSEPDFSGEEPCECGNISGHKCDSKSTCQSDNKSVMQNSMKSNMKSSAKIYGEWLLKETEHQLPQMIRFPEDIPVLVNRVYAEPANTEAEDSDWLKFKNRTEIQEGKAENWCLPSPKKSRRESGNSMVGLLDASLDSEKKAEACVRDGSSSVDVFVMRRVDEDHVGFLPWSGNNRQLRFDSVPSESEARQIALQRLRLPFVFGLGEKLNEVIETLEAENSSLLSPWQDSQWLKGELILLMNENGERDLCGYHLKYEKEYGLQYEKCEM